VSLRWLGVVRFYSVPSDYIWFSVTGNDREIGVTTTSTAQSYFIVLNGCQNAFWYVRARQPSASQPTLFMID